MQEHQLYLNLGDNNVMVARCSCGAWQQERQLKMSQRPSDVVRELEQEYDRHAEREHVAVHLPTPLAD